MDAAHHTVFARQASVDCLALAAAQLSEEHGERDGQLHGVWNYNLGNHDAPHSAVGDPNVLAFSTVPEREVGGDGIDYKWIHLRIAYASVDDGAVGYWRFWTNALQWIPSFDALTRGDPEAFAYELSKAGYYTGSESDYAKALTRLQPTWAWRWGQ